MSDKMLLTEYRPLEKLPVGRIFLELREDVSLVGLVYEKEVGDGTSGGSRWIYEDGTGGSWNPTLPSTGKSVFQLAAIKVSKNPLKDLILWMVRNQVCSS